MNEEARLLLQCARSVILGTPVPEAELRGVDWHRVYRAATRHRVQSLVYEAIRGTCESDLPRDVRESLLLDYHRTGLRNEHTRDLLATILDRAVRQGIEILLLKGAVLAYTAYPRPEHRSLGDIDLLVREQDFFALEEILRELGYASRVPRLPPSELPLYAHCFRQIRFRGRHPPPLEVHFRVLNLGMPSPIESAWGDPEHLGFLGPEVRTPSPERFLIHLCLHAQQHAFAMLRLFIDIAVWLRSRAIDLDCVRDLACRHHLGSTSFYALTYTAEMLETGPGVGAWSGLSPPRWKRRILESVWGDAGVRSLRARLDPNEVELPRVFLLGDAPLREKAAFLWRVLLPPREWLAEADPGEVGRRRRHLARVVRSAWDFTFSRRVPSRQTRDD